MRLAATSMVHVRVDEITRAHRARFATADELFYDLEKNSRK